MTRKLVLQDFLPYLLHRAGIRIGLMFSREIEHLNVTLPMWRVLVELWHNGDHRLGELAERTSIDLSTLSRLLVSMQRRQLIVRRRAGDDGRALSLTLTDKGLALTKRILPYAVSKSDLATQGMSASEVKMLRSLLKKVYANLNAGARETKPRAKAGPAAATQGRARAAPRKKAAAQASSEVTRTMPARAARSSSAKRAPKPRR